MRRHDVEKPYEKLKELTRGKRVNQEGMREFVKSLDIPQEAIDSLAAMTPRRMSVTPLKPRELWR